MAASDLQLLELAPGSNQNLGFDGVGPGQGFSTSRITLMAEEYGEAKFLSK
jgi:hypothetical protein